MFRSDDWVEHDAAWWLKVVMESLKLLAPAHFTNPARLSFGVYEAPKAEGSASGHLPHQPFVEDCSFSNLWAVWPTKLTLAPIASEQVIARIGGIRPSAVPAAWNAYRAGAPPVEIAPERWQKTPCLPWADFQRCYHL